MSPTMRTAIASFGAAWALGCGTVLHATNEPLGPDKLSRVRRGGGVMHCREQQSKEFVLFLVCPRDGQSIGFSTTNGKTTLTCKDLFPKNCQRLEASLNQAGYTAEGQSWWWGAQ